MLMKILAVLCAFAINMAGFSVLATDEGDGETVSDPVLALTSDFSELKDSDNPLTDIVFYKGGNKGEKQEPILQGSPAPTFNTGTFVNATGKTTRYLMIPEGKYVGVNVPENVGYEYSVELWLKFPDSTAGLKDIIFAFKGSNNETYFKRLKSGNKFSNAIGFGFKKGSNTESYKEETFDDGYANKWIHFIISNKDTITNGKHNITSTVYVNGVSKITIFNQTDVAAATKKQVEIGRSGNGAQQDVGMVNIYYTPLTATQAKAAYDKTVATFTEETETPVEENKVEGTATITQNGVGYTLSIPNGKITATETATGILVAAVLKGDQVVGIAKQDKYTTGTGFSNLTATITNVAPDDQLKIRFFIWDALDNIQNRIKALELPESVTVPVPGNQN